MQVSANALRPAIAAGLVGGLLLPALSTPAEAACFISSGSPPQFFCSPSQSFYDVDPAFGGHVIANHVLAHSASGIAQSLADAASSGIGARPEVFETGRIRTTSHDGFRTNSQLVGPGALTNGFNTQEASVFVSGSSGLPGTFLGASMRVTGLVGYLNQSTELNPGAMTGQQPKRVGGSDIDATFVGGSAVLAWKSGWYAVGTVIGFFGTTDTRDLVNNLRAKYDNRGIVTNLTVGTVVPLDAVAQGLKLDLRATGAYTGFEGDSFQLLNAQLAPSLSFWTAQFSPMLFTDIPFNGGTMRPYLQGTVKGLGGYENELRVSLTNGTFSDAARFTQHNTYWGAEIGINYGKGNWTFGAAGYTDQSKSEETYGGKIGASYKFN